MVWEKFAGKKMPDKGNYFLSCLMAGLKLKLQSKMKQNVGKWYNKQTKLSHC